MISMRRLIICEKNNAAERIASILSGHRRTTLYVDRVPIFKFEREGDSYSVIGLRGHILELDYPNEYNEWNKVEPSELIWVPPIKVTHARAIASALKSSVKDSDEIIIATDYDREGEAIGVEALGLLDVEGKSIKRAKFSSLTEHEILNAFSNLTDVDYNLAASAEARQEIDLVWGAVLTRSISLASNQFGRNFLSVGRVQSPTLALIVDREKEIQSFKPKPYWQLLADLEKDIPFQASHSEGTFWDEERAKTLFEKVKGARVGTVLDVKKEQKKERAPAPFDTTHLISAATYLGISAARTMQIAEELYMQGYISYPRTDNTVYPRTLGLRGILQRLTASAFKEEAEELLAQDKIVPTRGRKETTDHPPIYPVDVAPKDKVTGQHWMIYELIVRRFFATVAKPALSESSKVSIDINSEQFIADGYRILEPGWRKYYPYIKIKEALLPELEKGMNVHVLDVKIEKKETQPPRRYSQGDLILAMEKLGLGTKSTRAEIIQKLYDRGYIEGSTIVPTGLGIAVTDGLERHASEITRPEMTAKLEQEMDLIAEGKNEFAATVKDSRLMLDGVMKAMNAHRADMGAAIQNAIRKQNKAGKCPKCGSDLMIMRSGRGKRFIGCSGYPKCTMAYPLPQRGKIEIADKPCDVCGAPRIRVIMRGRPPWDLCANMNCPGKKKNQKNAQKSVKAEEKRAGGCTEQKKKERSAATKKKQAKKSPGRQRRESAPPKSEAPGVANKKSEKGNEN